MTVDGFVPALFLRRANRVYGLCVEVSGKSDEDKKYQRWLWADDNCPDLCPVRHLLIYVYLAGIKGGYLFPRSQELVGQNKPDDGIYLTCVSYNTFRKQFKMIVAQV